MSKSAERETLADIKNPQPDSMTVFDLLLSETQRPLLRTVMHVIGWVDKQDPSCRQALAWLLATADLTPPIREILYHAEELERTPFEIATYVDQLSLLLEHRDWQQPSDVLGAIDRPHLAELAHVATLRLRLHQQRNLRLAHVTQQLEVCLNRGKL